VYRVANAERAKEQFDKETMKMMTMEGSTAPLTIQRIAGRDLPLPAADFPWLALPVPIPHSATSLPARVLLAEFYFFSTYRALAWLSARKVSIPETPELALLP
jgi:hypothetical protein